jgi:hypothetical protein
MVVTLPSGPLGRRRLGACRLTPTRTPPPAGTRSRFPSRPPTRATCAGFACPAARTTRAAATQPSSTTSSSTSTGAADTPRLLRAERIVDDAISPELRRWLVVRVQLADCQRSWPSIGGPSVTFAPRARPKGRGRWSERQPPPEESGALLRSSKRSTSS